MLTNHRMTASIERVHAKLVEGLPQLNIASQLEAIGILLVLREAELILRTPLVMKIAAAHLLQFKCSYVLMLAAVNLNNSNALDLLTGSLEEGELIKLIVDHVLFVETLKPSVSSLLFEMCCKRLSPTGLKVIFKKILFQWASTSFPKVSSPNSQKMLSNLLSQLMSKIDVNEEDVVLAINQGITCRFQYFK